MKIAILGYGKMGEQVEIVALERKHKVVAYIDSEEDWKKQAEGFASADVAIDFSMPSVVMENIRRCFEAHKPVVVGTTGWYEQLEGVVHDCEQRECALFVASNFSIGMNIVFDLNRRLAKLMNGHEEYSVGITEVHHVHKLDAPSGTAIALARDIVEEVDRKDDWCLMRKGVKPKKDEVPIVSVREGEVPGVHEVVYDSAIDRITLKHEAKSRRGLAVGAVLAAEFLEGRKGYYTMKELLEL